MFESMSPRQLADLLVAPSTIRRALRLFQLTITENNPNDFDSIVQAFLFPKPCKFFAQAFEHSPREQDIPRSR